jgi:hypothetical protein
VLTRFTLVVSAGTNYRRREKEKSGRTENTGSAAALLVLCHAKANGFSDVWKNCEALRVATNAIYRVGPIAFDLCGPGQEKPTASAMKRWVL